MSAAIFMADAYTHGVRFYLGEDGGLKVLAPPVIVNDSEVMSLIRKHKLEIQKQLETGFDCVRDGLTIAEVKALTVAAEHGKVVSVARLAA